MNLKIILFGICVINLCIFGEIWCIRFEKHAIVNGFNNPIEPNQVEVPYQATLLAHVNGTYLIFCGGSLIHPRWILTAAHCLEQDGKQLPSNIMKIAVGTVFADLKKAQLLDVEYFHIHGSYLVSDSTDDIGLVKMKDFVKLSTYVKLVNLHTNGNEELLGQTAYLTGFGIVNDFYQRPTRLRQATLHINIPRKCTIDPKAYASQICCTSTIAEGKACKDSTMQNLQFDYEESGFQGVPINFCWDSKTLAYYIGDSGGPLVMTKNGRNCQIGITSHLAIFPFCKMTINNSVYTKVASYIPWMSTITGIDFYKYNTGC